MILITRKSLAENAANRWKEVYFKKGQWMNTIFSDSGKFEAVYNKLVALGSNPAPDDVDNTIGNLSWTMLVCNECGSKVQEVVQLGEAPDYESQTAQVCFKCLKEAVKLTKGVK